MLRSYDKHGRKRLTPFGVMVIYAVLLLIAVMNYPLDRYSSGLETNAVWFDIRDRITLFVPIIITMFSAWRIGSWLAIALPFIGLTIGLIGFRLGALHCEYVTESCKPANAFFAVFWFSILMGSAIAGYVLYLIVRAVRAGIDF